MSIQAKILIPIFLLIILYAVYVLTATDDIGSFENVRASGEINRNVNVLVDNSMDFEKDASGNIISFYARDKHNAQAKISLQEAAPAEIVNAEIVELFGHMHGDNFVALRATIVKLRSDQPTDLQ